MNETNILADVEVPHVDMDYAGIFLLQYNLQERLNQLPESLSNYKHMASKCVYWGHCIRAEVDELLEWLVQRTDPTWLKEMQMEAIDIVHFVFNIGLEIGFTADSINSVVNSYEHQDWPVDASRVHAATILLDKSVIILVNKLPWKTWKTYQQAPIMEAVGMDYVQVLRACLMVCNATGLNRQGIINMYCAKNGINHQRQDNGY